MYGNNDEEDISDIVAVLGESKPREYVRHALVLWWLQLPKDKRSFTELESIARDYLAACLKDMPAFVGSNRSLSEWISQE